MKNLKIFESVTPDVTIDEETKKTPPFRLSINFGDDAIDKSHQTLSNATAFERFMSLAKNGYYFTIQPKTSRNGDSYLWIIASKQGEDREEFSLRVNNEILNAVFAVLTGKSINISGIDPDNVDTFNANVQNFELSLYKAEKAAGRTMKKTHSVTGQTIASYYKNGVMVYKPYLNPEFKAYLFA